MRRNVTPEIGGAEFDNANSWLEDHPMTSREHGDLSRVIWLVAERGSEIVSGVSFL